MVEFKVYVSHGSAGTHQFSTVWWAMWHEFCCKFLGK